MKKRNVSAVMVPLAAAGFALRWLVYPGAVDGKNLIVPGHPLVVALWTVTAAALVLAAFLGWTRKGSVSNPGSAPAFLGHGLLAVGLVLAVLLNPVSLPGVLGLAWKLLAIVSAVCLLPAGFDRMRGKTPFFALYIPTALFFVVNVVVHYPSWCANPQFTDYAFALLGSVMLALHSYQCAAASLDEGNRRILAVTALAAVFLCGTEIAHSMYPYLYLGGALFCLTDPNR